MKRITTCLILLLAIALLSSSAEAKKKGSGISTIRDDETERYLHEICDPVFRAAGLEPKNISFFIVNDPTLNAYVAGGQKIFVHTGLIIEAPDPNMLIGVLAHESGHIRGGHLIRKREEFENASTEALIGYALGLGSLLAGASPGAAAAAISGSQQVAMRDLLKYSRGHEEAADQAALEFLSRAHVSPRGLMTLLEKLGTQQTLMHGARTVNPYLQTHPMFPERISHIREYLKNAPNADYASPEKLVEKHKRIVAKLKGFMDDPKRVLAAYPESDSSVPARYGRAIALYRIPQLEKALATIDGLIAEFPSDPYFKELKGQMLFENGRIQASTVAYEGATELAANAPMMRLALANALIAEETPAAYKEAITHLQRVVVMEPRNGFAWHQMGIAYGRLGDLGNSYLALAEEALLQNRKDDTLKYVQLAEKNLTPGSRGAFKAKEIKEALERFKKKRDGDDGDDD